MHQRRIVDVYVHRMAGITIKALVPDFIHQGHYCLRGRSHWTQLFFRKYVFACPSQPLSPETTALFWISPDGEPLRHGEADKALRLLLQTASLKRNANMWSLHSLRIGAACAL